MTKTTTVGDFMTSGPHSIGQEQTMAEAHRLMRAHRIRHLPVLHGGRLVGIVTERDLHLLETLSDVRPETVTVEEAMSQDVYTVAPSIPLREVALAMWRKKYGSAVVVDEKKGKVMGVFTTVDALRALATLLAPRPRVARPARNAGVKSRPSARRR